MDLFKLVGSIFVKNEDANEKIDETTDKAEKSSGKLGKAFGAIATGIGTAVVAGATAVATLTKGSLDAYANYEQLTGGVETLFGTSAEKVMQYADNAYQTAGLSANAYMETITGFSASLLQGLGGDTETATEIANMAITDMADNANKMGTSMESIQSAYQGFAKQNYTMLDNLKLGYGGTQEEMIRLVNNSGILNEKIESLDGITFDQMIQAIHVVQDNLGITGTTALEASSTISGSLSSLQSAWANTLVAMGNDGGDFEGTVSQLVDSAMTVFQNIVPRIEVILKSIPQLVTQLTPEIPGIIAAVLPSLIDGAIGLLNGLVAALPSLIDTFVNDCLPGLISGILALIVNIVSNLADIIEPIIQALPDIIMMIITGILSNLPAIIAGLVRLVIMLVQNIPTIIAELIRNIPLIIQMIIEALIESFPMLRDASVQLWNDLVAGIADIFAAIGEVVIKAFNKLVGWCSMAWEWIQGWLPGVLEEVGAVLSAAWDAISTAFSSAWTAIKDFFVGIWTSIKNFISGILNGIASIFTNVWTSIRSGVTSTVTNIWSTISTKFESIKTAISTKLTAAKNTVTGIFDSIKQAIEDKITAAKDVVSDVIDRIKNLFHFEWKLPDLKLPHITISPKGWDPEDLLKGVIPKLGIEWYAKGGILKQPTIFGMNGSNLMVGGEAGDEAVAPIETLQKYIGEAVGQKNEEVIGVLHEILDAVTGIDADLYPSMSDAVSNLKLKVNEREFGRLVRGVPV